jgi:putative ABC transport system substrate-binding protein
LRELGYVEGENLVVERRYAEGKIDRLPELARELVRLRVDVILAVGTGASQAAKAATATIPVVLLSNVDPIKAGLVASLAHPSGNVTGVLIAPDGTLAAKKLELLKEAVPRAIRIALLAPDDPSVGIQQQEQEVRRAASSLSVELRVVVVQGSDYDRAFATIDAGRPQALFVGAHTFFVRDAQRIVELAAKYRLPAIYEWPQQVQAGGLMSYGANDVETYRQLATYIDRILKGSKPGDLPIWQPSKLRLVINLKTAKALGLTIPQSILIRADEVIQ